MTDTSSINAADAGVLELGGDLTVHRLGFGAMRITGDGIWGEPPDRDGAKAALRRAVELGVNFIDTADSYGPEVSETLIAEALHPYPDDLVIATKGGLERTGPGRWPPTGGPSTCARPARAACAGCASTRSRSTSSTGPTPAVPLEDSIGALVELKDEGKIRHIGVSQRHRGQLRRAQPVTPIVSVQNRYNVDRPHVGVDRRPVRAGADGVPAVGADPRRRRQPVVRRDRRPPRRDTAAGRAGLAARSVAGDAADPGHGLGRAPREQRRGRSSRARPRRGRRDHRAATHHLKTAIPTCPGASVVDPSLVQELVNRATTS